MIDDDIRSLANRAPDRILDRLEVDIWASLARQERGVAASRRLLAVQGLVLIMTLAGSVAVGRYIGRSPPRDVDVFSPRMALSPAALVVGDEG